MPRDKSESTLSAEPDVPYTSIKKIIRHALDPATNLVTLTVLSKDNRVDDISEWDLQEHCPALLYDYWASVSGGRTRQHVLGIGELYHPYRLLRHRRVRGQWQVQVQWLGYSAHSDDVSWEPADKIRVDAPAVLMDYCGYVDDGDENAKAALLGSLVQRTEEEDVKPVVVGATPKRSATKRKHETGLPGQVDGVSQKRRRSSKTESSPAAGRTPATAKSSAYLKRRQSQTPAEASPPGTGTPDENKKSKSLRRQAKMSCNGDAGGGAVSAVLMASSPACVQQQQQQQQQQQVPAARQNQSQSQHPSPTDIPRTMMWFMDDFTVGDMQKVCRFIDENCTGKLRLPLYSGGDWDGKTASGRWEDVFMESPLGRLGRYDNEAEKDK